MPIFNMALVSIISIVADAVFLSCEGSGLPTVPMIIAASAPLLEEALAAGSFRQWGGSRPLPEGSRFLFRYFLVFWGIFYGFMCVDVEKTARVTRMRLMPKLQSVFFGYFFGFAVMGHADRDIERTLSRMTQSRPVP